MLVNEKVRLKADIPDDIALSANDVTDLSSLPIGYFDENFGEVVSLPTFKPSSSAVQNMQNPQKIISFPNAFERLD